MRIYFYQSFETVLYKSCYVYFPVHFARMYSRPPYPPGTIYTLPHVLNNLVVCRTQNDVASLSLGRIIARTVGARKPSNIYSTTTMSRNVICATFPFVVARRSTVSVPVPESSAGAFRNYIFLLQVFLFNFFHQNRSSSTARRRCRVPSFWLGLVTSRISMAIVFGQVQLQTPCQR